MEPTLRPLLDDLDRDRFNQNMDEHFDRHMAEREDLGSAEVIRRAVWGDSEQGPAAR